MGIRAGQLREPLTVWNQSGTAGPYGEVETSSTSVGTIYGRVVATSGAERVTDVITQETAEFKVTVRRGDADSLSLTAKSALVSGEDSRAYNVMAVLPSERRDHYVLLCNTRSTDGLENG